MNKEVKLWKKQEKRIVKLLYKKGFLTDFKIEDFYWAEFRWLRGKKYTSKRGYKYPMYLPEVHFGTTDYWGEGNEHSLVDSIFDTLFWKNVDYDKWDKTSGEWPESTFSNLTRPQFIKYLRGLPTKINDNKIRKILNLSNNYG